MVATLTLLDDATANPSVLRLLTSPRWAIGIPDLALLGRRARELSAARRPDGAGQPESDLEAVLSGSDPACVPSLLEAVADPGPLSYSGDARRRFAAFAGELGLLRRHAGDAVTELVQRVIAVLGLAVELEAVDAGGSAPLATFVQAVADYTDIDADASLAGLLAYLEAEREYGTGLEQAVVSAADSVKVLTVHKAKGLEWDVVFVPGLAADVFPTDRVTGNWLRNASSLPYPLRGDASALPQLGRVDNGQLTGVRGGAHRAAAAQRGPAGLRRGDPGPAVAAGQHAHLGPRPGEAARPVGLLHRPLPRTPSGSREAIDVPRHEPAAGRGSDHVGWPAVGDTVAWTVRREAAALVRDAPRAAAGDGDYPGGRRAEPRPAGAGRALARAARPG